MSFRKDFAWGEATSSYQIEGGAFIDGKGWDIWDVYCKEEGKTLEKSVHGRRQRRLRPWRMEQKTVTPP